MAHNDLKHDYSSTEGEETSGSDSDEVSDRDSGEKQQQEANKTPLALSKSANKPQAPDPSSSESGSDTDMDSGSDSDSPPKSLPAAEPNVKPISSIPTERSVKRNDSKLVKKAGSETNSTPSLAKSKRPPAVPATIEKDTKKAKHDSVNVEPTAALISPSKSANKSRLPNLSSSEADSDTDSDLQPKKSNVVDFNGKPNSSVPMESKSVKKLLSKTTPTPSPAKRKPLAAKANGEDSKKAKNTNTAPDDNSKKQQQFKRMFSEYDEIVILKGMIDYKVEKNGESHIADISEFHEFIKKSLHADVSNAQLADKVRRMKKKYVTKFSREEDGKEPSFSKTNEQKAYELSKLIWCSDSHNSGKESKKNPSLKNGNSKDNAAGTSTGTSNAASLLTSNGVDGKQKSKTEGEKKIDVSLFVRYSGLNDSLILPEEIVKAGMELVDGSKRAELEVKWKELKEQELEVYVKRMELLKEQALVVLEAIRSSGN